MSATIHVDLHTSIQKIDNSLVIVGFDIHLDPSGKQGNIVWPYTVLENGEAPSSETSITIYADTVTLYSDLTNIGKNISIFAREIIVTPNVIINVSAADTWVAEPAIPNYKIFNPAPNPTPSTRSTGPKGSDGGTGCDAGSITLVAQQFSELPSPPTYQPNRTRLFNTGHLLESLFANLWSDSKIVGNFQNIPLPDFNLPAPTIDFTIPTPLKPIHVHYDLEFAFRENKLLGAQNCSSITRSISQSDNKITIDINFGPIQLASQAVTIYVNGQPHDEAVLNCSFILGASLHFILESDGTTLRFDSISDPAIQDVNFVIKDRLLFDGNPFSLGPYCTNKLSERLMLIIAPQFKQILPILGDGFAVAYSAVRKVGGKMLTMANGGIGGRGQDGGTGGAAGQGGNGGSSGNGGNGGVINVYSGDLAPGFLLATAVAGFGEQVALPGNGGLRNSYIGGPLGSAGASGQNGTPGTVKLNGSAYRYLQKPPDFDHATFADQLSIGQLLLEQQGAKLAFISAEVPDDSAKTQDNYKAVIPLYLWLYDATFPYVVGNPGNRPPTAVATLKGINSAASLALSRLNAGMSYYGTPITWTPATSASAWNQYISSFINYGNILSQAYTTASAAQASNQTQIDAVIGAKGTIDAQLSMLNSQIKTLQVGVNSLSESIGQMTRQIDAQTNKITSEITADARAYLQDIGMGCSLEDIVKILQGIYAVGSSIAKAEEDIVGAIKGIGKGLKDIYDANHNAIASVQTAQANVASLQTAWKTLQEDLNGNASAGVIAIDGEKFETFVNQTFGGYSFTAQLLADMHALITLGQRRNTARSTLTIQIAEILKLKAEVAQFSNYAEYIQAMAAESVVPVEPQYVQFLANSYNYTANCIVDMMWEMNQALQYLTTSPLTLQITGIDIATLSAKQAQLTQELAQAKEEAAKSFASFAGIPYKIPCGPETPAHSQLTASKKMVFSLPTSVSAVLFSKAGSVTLTELTVTLDGLSGFSAQAAVDVGIGQIGPDSRYNVNTENWMAFPHAPVTTEYRYVPSSQKVQVIASFANGDNYNGVSPFAYWVLDFSSELNDWIDWSLVKTVVLNFSGTMQPKHVSRTAGGKIKAA